jgi:hypothetical protein
VLLEATLVLVVVWCLSTVTCRIRKTVFCWSSTCR